MNPDELNKVDFEKIQARIDSLEERIAFLESNREMVRPIRNYSENEIIGEGSEFVDKDISSSSIFETNLGEYGLAWLGTMLLFFAIAFIGQYFINNDRPFISLAIGIVSVVACLTISNYSRKNFTYLSFTFYLFSFLISFYFILRLHYYTSKPVLTNELFEILLLLIVVGVQLYFAVRRRSQTLAGWAFVLALITAFVSNDIQPFFLISLLTSGIVLYSFWKYGWWKAMVFVLTITYLMYFIWIFKNHALLFKSPDDISYYFAFIYVSLTTAIYSLIAFKKPSDAYHDGLILSIILLAGIAYSILLMLLVFMHTNPSFVPFFTAISIYCIAYSIILKYYSPWEYSPSLYALFGFVGISITVYGIYLFPDSFLLLICQSFLVLVLALWYRSQTITLINTFLLLILISVYYKISGELNAVNFSIPIVAFLSARFINWQKQRLNIKTDFIRNIYLFTLFFTLLYATYKGLPGQFIAVSWLFIAGLYFGLSIVIKSIKYRWMALGNLLVSAIYLFLVDMAKTDVIFRILAFLVFAVVSISISIYYVRKIKKKDNSINQNNS